MQPNVTIVLPVYNVEPYLRQCLDSVVNQTMREIQIICVNDGSTDGSPAILEEYAAKDPRIMLIHQENQGGGSARNTAFPHIQGKYTYFVDPDDWIDLHLCEKLFQLAEKKQTEMLFLEYAPVNCDGKTIPRLRRKFPLSEFEVEKPLALKKAMYYGMTATVNKFWLSDFLLKNEIRFAEGKRAYNDKTQNWKGLALATRIDYTNEELYYYRVRPFSYQHKKGNKIIVVQLYQELKHCLQQIGAYESHREIYLKNKMIQIFRAYANSPREMKKAIFDLALEHFDEDDRAFRSESLLSCFHSSQVFCKKVFAKKDKYYFSNMYYSIMLALHAFGFTQLRRIYFYIMKRGV